MENRDFSGNWAERFAVLFWIIFGVFGASFFLLYSPPYMQKIGTLDTGGILFILFMGLLCLGIGMFCFSLLLQSFGVYTVNRD